MLDQEFLATVPHAPGVYMMLDKASTVLYVGKAKDLAKRIASYVRYSGTAISKTAVMLKQVHHVDVLITHTEKEALILEASLIKRHRPKYNVILRDDKSYPLIKVTVQESWPRVFMTRKKKNDGARYFGPYTSASSMWSTLRLLLNVFPLRRCKGSELKERRRPCLNYQMQQCLAPCAGKASHEDYLAMVEKVIFFLEGKNDHLLTALEQEMNHAANNLDFERAASCRDRLQAVRHTLEKQLVVSQSAKDRDVFGSASHQSSIAFTLLIIRDGIITGTRCFALDDPYGDAPTLLSQILKLYYDENNPPPAEIILPYDVDDRPLISERLGDLAGRKIRLNAAHRGDSRKLVKMAETNARQYFEDQEKKQQSWEHLAGLLADRLQTSHNIESIECLDISTIGGEHAVGSLIRFSNGEPDHHFYRHYRIATPGPDDYAMMKEVLQRRFERAIEKNDLPDLFMVDGGRGQLGVAEAVLKDHGLQGSTTLLGIAKERDQEGDKLYLVGRKNPLLFLPHNPVLLFLMRVRDEAHRYGISVHRSLRRKRTLSSQLDLIPGVGMERRKRLLRKLGSVRKIAQATVAELQTVDGIGSDLAEAIHAHFNQQPVDIPIPPELQTD